MIESLAFSLDNFFGITLKGSSIRTEILAGITTFFSLCYIFVVNPVILMAVGVPFGDAVWATVITSCVGTLLIGVYANRPYAVAPLMSQSTLIVYTLCRLLHYSWYAVLGANLIAGIFFFLFVHSRFWEILIQGIPDAIGRACTRSIGFFIAFLGSSNSGIVVIGTVAMAEPFYRDIQPSNLAVFLAGIIVIGIMMIRKSPGALICGILASTLCAFALGIEKIPSVVPLCAPDLSGSLFKSELFTTLTPEIIPIVVLFFLLTFFDSIATILGLSSLTHQAGRPEELQEIRKPFLINAFSMIFSPLVGSTTTGIFIESVSGVKEGGRTGLVAVTVAVLMAASLFFLPLIEAFPKGATAAVLMVIGLLMLAQFRVQSFSNREELLTAFVLMVTMSITQNIGLGLSIGLLVYPVFMAAAGKHTEISRSFWFLVGCAVLFLTMFPY